MFIFKAFLDIDDLSRMCISIDSHLIYVKRA